MIANYFDSLVKSVPALDEQGGRIKQALHSAVLDSGESARNFLDLLHGTWLGHPLHPLLTDVSIGAWVMGALFDGLASGSDSRQAEQAADTLVGVGTAAAVPTVLTGLADYSTISQRATGTGLLHGLLNALGFSLYLLSVISRKRGRRSQGVSLSTLALGLITIAAWIGGHLVFKQRIGVNHAHPASKPEEWQPVLKESDLPEQEPKRVEVEGNPVVLYRFGETVYAIGATCSHAGAPLDEGDFEDFCVQCPWHDSVFDLRDGSVVHGPATYSQPVYASRIFNGQVQVRALP